MLHPDQQILAERFCLNEEAMLAAADTMAAAAATTFNAHGYDQFILAREMFVSMNHALFEMVAARVAGD